MNVTKLADAQDGLYDLAVLVNGQKAAVVHIAQSANINALYITSDDPATQGRDFVDASKSNIATGKLLVVDKDGKTVRSRSSRRAATPPSPTPRRSPTRSNSTASPT